MLRGEGLGEGGREVGSEEVSECVVRGGVGWRREGVRR